MASAQARAKEIMAEGQQEAASYFNVFAQNPELAIFLKEIEALKESLQQKATIILDTKTPPFTLLEKKPEIQE